MSRVLSLVAIAAGSIFVAVSIVLAAGGGRGREPWAERPPLGTPVERRVPPLRLVGSDGRPTSLAAYRGRWLVIAPSLTLCHEVCPLTTGALTELRHKLRRSGLGRRVAVAEVSVDPWRDSPARLRAYRRLTGLDFELLTGSRRELRRLWHFFGVGYRRIPADSPAPRDWWTGRAETFDVQHTDGVFIVDPSGVERVAAAGMPDVGRVEPALQSLLGAEGRANLARPRAPWTTAGVLSDLRRLIREDAAGPGAAAARRALAGSPPRLAELHREAGRLDDAPLGSHLRGLRGYPVVLNAWASWCLPCREEFPLLAAAAARYGKRVAFLGADVEDSAADARAFLAQHPVSYPSYELSASELRAVAPVVGFPTTIFLDRSGGLAGVHPGQYRDADELRADIRRYALGG